MSRRSADDYADEPLRGEPLVGTTAEERQWGMFCHLSALLGMLVGGQATNEEGFRIWRYTDDSETTTRTLEAEVPAHSGVGGARDLCLWREPGRPPGSGAG